MVERRKEIHINIEKENPEALQVVKLPITLSQKMQFFDSLEKLNLKRGEKTQIKIKTHPNSIVSGWVNYKLKNSVRTPYWETMSDEEGNCDVCLRIPNKKATDGELVVCIKPENSSFNFYDIDCNLE